MAFRLLAIQPPSWLAGREVEDPVGDREVDEGGPDPVKIIQVLNSRAIGDGA